MMRAWLASLWLLAAVGFVPVTSARAEISAKDQVAAMGPGINILGGYDPYWRGEPTTFRLKEDFRLAREAGFKTARIAVFTFPFLSAEGRLDPAWLKRLDAVIAEAEAQGFTVIIDEHDFEACAADVDACAVKLANTWYELSERYQGASDKVVFELLNEPNGKIDAVIWNGWLPDLIGIVRKTNPTRNLIIGPVGWNNLAELPTLKLPEADRHLIATFHYYSPFDFTHQGATWAGPEMEKRSGVRWLGQPAEIAAIEADFDKVSAWAKAQDRPILLGEFGAYNLHGKLEDRARWTKAVAEAADRRGFARAYWYWDGGFGVWDEKKRVWVTPIRDALLGKSGR
jgi:endoglucanase